MLEEFRKYTAEHKLFDASDKLLLAVSGGIDSMVMTELLKKTGHNIGIAHCNFNLRGAESDRDEAFVKRYAVRSRIAFHSEKFDTTGYAAEKGISIQMAARELRYRWFEEVRIQYDYDYIVLAHNMNDNIETFLINLTRGTGIAGLTGMRPKFRKLVRPLLFASRNAITDYCMQNKIKFREDRSNADTKYTRNKIRLTILPLFREINPSFDSTITETAERLGEINDIVTLFISEIRKKAIIKKGNMVCVKLKELGNLPVHQTILYELFRPYGITSGQATDLVKLTNSKTGSHLITREYRLVKNRNEILIIPGANNSDNYYEIDTIDEFCKFPGIISAELKLRDKDFVIPSSNDIACIDADKIIFPVIIRKWIIGDFFYPLGMKSRKKLSDYFIDKKYSIPLKEEQFILESAGNIVWVIGDRIDNRYRITPSTRRTIILKSVIRQAF